MRHSPLRLNSYHKFMGGWYCSLIQPAAHRSMENAMGNGNDMKTGVTDGGVLGLSFGGIRGLI